MYSESKLEMTEGLFVTRNPLVASLVVRNEQTNIFNSARTRSILYVIPLCAMLMCTKTLDIARSSCSAN